MREPATRSMLAGVVTTRCVTAGAAPTVSTGATVSIRSLTIGAGAITRSVTTCSRTTGVPNSGGAAAGAVTTGAATVGAATVGTTTNGATVRSVTIVRGTACSRTMVR